MARKKKIIYRNARKKKYVFLFLLVCLFLLGIGYSNLSTNFGITGFLAMQKFKPTFEITLDNQNASVSGTSIIYEKYSVGIFLNKTNGRASDSMSTNTNPISLPEKEYEIDYNYNGGSGSTSSASFQSVFNGYYTEEDGAGTKYIDENGFLVSTAGNTDFTSNSTLYAYWTGGGLILPTPNVRNYYVFNGWYTEQNSGTRVGGAGDEFIPTETTTLWAHWTPCGTFVNDAWDIVAACAQMGYPGYSVGDTRTIELDNELGSHIVRVANTSTPSECSTAGFSKTACGFVVEFADIIIRKPMNSSGKSIGGWSSAELRSYISSSYNSTSVLNSLPNDLKSLIIDTEVVSGYSCISGWSSGTCSNPDNGGQNFITSDKLYLLSYKEVYGSSTYDTAATNTRQIDYYSNVGVTSSNYSDAKKQFNNSNYGWYLRTAVASRSGNFYVVDSDGSSRSNYGCQSGMGVSPAFRLTGPSSAYKIVYDGQNYVEPFVVAAFIGESVILPLPEKCGYNFVGWYDAESGGNKIGDNGDSYTPSSNITLYAHWTPKSSFTTDSWTTVVSYVQSGNTSRYVAGDEKAVELGNNLGTHCIRVVNNSNYGCSLASKTACGFVLEFKDVIGKRYFDDDTSTNSPGWTNSSIRTYLNSTSDTTSVYNSLPSELRNAIINTTVISGYGCISGFDANTKICGNPYNSGQNYSSTDKLYFLSVVETYGVNDPRSDTVTTSHTRQLDYYRNLGVSFSNYSALIKYENAFTSTWWHRSALAYSNSLYNGVYDEGYQSASNTANGVSPAFRLKG